MQKLLKNSQKSSLALRGATGDHTQEADFLEALIERFQVVANQSILNKRQPIAKSDPKEEIYELHLEIQEVERQFRELVDIASLMLRKNRDLGELVGQRQDLVMAEQIQNETRQEVTSLADKVQEQTMQLEDQKDKYRQLKQHCLELEQGAQEQHQQRKYFQQLYEQQMLEHRKQSGKQNKSSYAEKAFESRISELEEQLREAQASLSQQDVQLEQFAQNLAMEQETSNNLIVSLDTAQSKIELLESRRDKFISKIGSRDRLVKELEGVIEDLTEQVQRDQNLLKLAEQNRFSKQDSSAVLDIDQTDLYGDMPGEDVNQSQHETERPLSPIPHAKQTTQTLKESLTAAMMPEMFDSVRVKVPMANFAEMTRNTERRASFELRSIMQQKPADGEASEHQMLEKQLFGGNLMQRRVDPVTGFAMVKEVTDSEMMKMQRTESVFSVNRDADILKNLENQVHESGYSKRSFDREGSIFSQGGGRKASQFAPIFGRSDSQFENGRSDSHFMPGQLRSDSQFFMQGGANEEQRVSFLQEEQRLSFLQEDQPEFRTAGERQLTETVDWQELAQTCLQQKETPRSKSVIFKVSYMREDEVDMIGAKKARLRRVQGDQFDKSRIRRHRREKSGNSFANTSLIQPQNTSLMQLQGNMGTEGIPTDFNLFNNSNMDLSKLEMSRMDTSKMIETSTLEDNKMFENSKLLESSVLNTSKVNTSAVNTSKLQVSKEHSGDCIGGQTSTAQQEIPYEQMLKSIDGVVQELPEESSSSVDRTQSIAQSVQFADMDLGPTTNKDPPNLMVSGKPGVAITQQEPDSEQQPVKDRDYEIEDESPELDKKHSTERKSYARRLDSMIPQTQRDLADVVDSFAASSRDVSPNRRTRSLQNITILGLSNKTGALKNAYDLVASHDQDHELDFKYNEQTLQDADREEIKLNERHNSHNTSIMSSRSKPTSARNSQFRQKRPLINMTPIVEEPKAEGSKFQPSPTLKSQQAYKQQEQRIAEETKEPLNVKVEKNEAAEMDFDVSPTAVVASSPTYEITEEVRWKGYQGSDPPLQRRGRTQFSDPKPPQLISQSSESLAFTSRARNPNDHIRQSQPQLLLVSSPDERKSESHFNQLSMLNSHLKTEDGHAITQSVIDGSSSSSQRRRSTAKRKEPEREFFEMTVLAFQLSHPNSKSILTVDRNRLYRDCHEQHKSFHDWPRWINATLTRIMLNERYNNERNIMQSLRQSVRIQGKIDKMAKSQRMRSREMDGLRQSTSASVLGASFISTWPMVVEDEFILEQTPSNQRGTVLCGFKLNDNYMCK